MKNYYQTSTLKQFLFKRIDTEKVLNEDTILKFGLAIACCALVFNFMLFYVSILETPLIHQDLMTPAIQEISYQTGRLFEANGQILQQIPQAFSLTQGPLLDAFVVTEYIGQSINNAITHIIEFTQLSLNSTVATSFASTY